MLCGLFLLGALVAYIDILLLSATKYQGRDFHIPLLLTLVMVLITGVFSFAFPEKISFGIIVYVI